MRFDAGSAITDTGVVARLIFTGLPQYPASGTVVVAVHPPESVHESVLSNRVTVAACQTVDVPVVFQWRDRPVPVTLRARASVESDGEPLWLRDTVQVGGEGP
jgi:hypothetical protein